MSDQRREALRAFTLAMVENRGRVSDGEWEAFMAAGWSHQQALEVVYGIAMKVMSNFTNALASVPLDEVVEHERS